MARDRLTAAIGRYHHLEVIAERRIGHGTTCFCRCACGALLDVPLSALRLGHRRSCGCRTGEVYRATRRANDKAAARAASTEGRIDG